ncbi:MAG: heme biosynthesis HemY N-terminal domain-containing protein [Pseudomonadota bacterium]|nr:heme biosynthesis HemY N-terminal domain-containing protein [Pseudomonadota bacterium]
MKYLIYLLATLFIVVGAAFYLRDLVFTSEDPGHVLIGYGNWQIETSLYFSLAALVVSFVVIYIVVRLLLSTIWLPSTLKKRGLVKRTTHSFEGLVWGLVDAAEGNWAKAEKSLIRNAASSGIPLMHYLTAAKAAQARGAFSKRDEYLQLANESTPGSELVVGLTEAELQLSNKQFDKALDSLKILKSIAPSHASVLRLLHETYRQMEDWQAIRKLLPDLKKNRVLMEAQIKLLETESYSELLKEAVGTEDLQALKTAWDGVPSYIKSVPGMGAVYYAGMIRLGGGHDIEDELRKSLEKSWDETLVVLYGCIQSGKPKKQLSRAESWVSQHSGDAILMRMLGKLCIRLKLFDKAKMYLQSSIDIEPSVDAYLCSGDLASENGEPSQALQNYRKGLLLASDEVVKRIDYMPPEAIFPDADEGKQEQVTN